MSKYLTITQVGLSPSGKTKIWHVASNHPNHQDFEPGVIRWHGSWRKYVYETEAAFYDWEALRMIADFCETATKDHTGK